MAQQTLVPPSEQDELHLLPQTTMEESLWASLRSNIRAALFPEKLPPLVLTSRPVKVRDIWGEYNYKKQSAGVSLMVHIVMIAGLIYISIMGARAVKHAVKHESIVLIAPDLTPQLPMTKKSEHSCGWWRRRWRSRQAAGAERQAAEDGDGADHASGNGDSQRQSQAAG